jgi:V8-like Glu-specific endopeptidase
MRKIIFSVFIIVVFLILVIQPALAITNGQLDGDLHPYVGALAVVYPDGSQDWVCSGTLIAPKVFLTAAHCVDWLAPYGIDSVYVSFDPVFDPAKKPLFTGRFVIAPLYKNGLSHDYDMALVLLDKRVSGIAPASLPEKGFFDQVGMQILRNQLFTAVGYGSSGRTNGSGQPYFSYDGIRRNTVTSFNSLDNNWLHLSMNPATDDGGTCYGDSGGPNFFGAGKNETKIIAGLTITGDMVCRATNVIIRLDTAAAHNFIDPYLK